METALNVLEKGIRLFKTTMRDQHGESVTVIGLDIVLGKGLPQRGNFIKLYQTCQVAVHGEQVSIFPLEILSPDNTIELNVNSIIYEITVSDPLFKLYVGQFWASHAAALAEKAEEGKVTDLPAETPAEG